MAKKLIKNQAGKVVTEAAIHARIAPSAMKGYEICPSYKASKGSTKASERGSLLHDKLEEHEDEAYLHAETEEDQIQLEKIGDYIAPFLRDAKRKKAKVLKEHTFNLRKLEINGCEQGTGDLLILWEADQVADLFDYKMGWWEVDDAEVNIQMWDYVLGVFIENPLIYKVNVHVLQPARDEVGSATFNRADVPRLLLRARTIADRVDELDGIEFNPVFDNCLWCANKANCRAMHQMALRAGNQARLKLPNAINLDPEVFGLENLDVAGDVYDCVDLITKWATAMKWKITGLARDGEDIPGHDLREVSGKRIIVDPEGAFEVLRDNYDVSLSEFLAVSNPSITGLLKTAGAKAEHGQKAKTQAAASESLMGAGVITQSQPSAYLVRVKTTTKG